MPRFTIETTYHLPVYRHRTYEADTLDQACQLAVEDDDWSGERSDADSSGETYVSGVWPGADAAYTGSALPIPSQFAGTVQRKADHFETLLGVLKILAHVEDLRAPDLPCWLPRALAVIGRAEAILAGKPDPADTTVQIHMLAWIDEARVRKQIDDIVETARQVIMLPTGAVTDTDIRAACRTVMAQTDLAEERDAAEFRAALAAIREAERRQALSV